jgi:hypothetical protein
MSKKGIRYIIFGMHKSNLVFVPSYPSEMRKKMSGTPDDYKVVPEKIQENIFVFIEETLFPEILARIEPEFPKLFRTPIKRISQRKFFKHLELIESSFVKKHRDYLMKLKVVDDLPFTSFYKIYGKDLIGAAIHIIKDMGNQKMEDDLRNIVKGCFIPNEDPDLTRPLRRLYFSGWDA